MISEKEKQNSMENLDDSYVLRVQDLVKIFKSGHVRNFALDGVSLNIKRGETVAVVGESGSGKTTLGLSVVRLINTTSGTITFNGRRIDNLREGKLRGFRKLTQMVFQDPYSSLNPYNTIFRSVAAPLDSFGIPEGSLMEGNDTKTSKETKRRLVAEMLDRVGLSPGESFLDQYPRKLSGGQRQRAALARSLIMRPELVVMDEPTSMLDVSISSQVINLIKELKNELNFSVMYISHEIATSKYISDRMAVMNLGRIVELGDSDSISFKPAHPYTDILIKAMPDIHGIDTDTAPKTVDFSVYNGGMKGCTFAHSCPFKTEICETNRPELEKIDADHYVACFHPLGQ